MDPVAQIAIDKDTTFALALEAQARGYGIWYVLIEDLMMKDEKPFCHARQILFQRDRPCYEFVSEKEKYDLDDFDVVLMRKDPPFDQTFFFATHFLSLCKKAKVINDPLAIRNAPEKIYSLNFKDIFPPSLICNNVEEIKNFMHSQGGEIIVKPLQGCGGYGVIYLHHKDQNFHSLLELSTKEGTEYVLAQKYLPEIREGDKRVIIVNGKAEGAILRIPQPHEHRANIHTGGTVKFAPLTERDQWLIERISQKLKEDGLFFVGLDIIGDYVSEINVTSPTGIQEIYTLGGIDIAKIFWDKLEKLT